MDLEPREPCNKETKMIRNLIRSEKIDGTQKESLLEMILGAMVEACVGVDLLLVRMSLICLEGRGLLGR